MRCSIVRYIIILFRQKSLKCFIITHFGLIHRLNVFGALCGIRITEGVTTLAKFLRKVRLWLKVKICDHLIVGGLTRGSEHIRLRWLLNWEHLLEVSLTVEWLFTLVISLLLCFGQLLWTWVYLLIQHAHIGNRVWLCSCRNCFFVRTCLEACLLLLLLFKERFGILTNKLGRRSLLVLNGCCRLWR